ncbi:loricrin, putative [Trichomonas vaginalis G3]|uniref:receptor protein-tyrosine kinase n=1 Tax=Trichomonas vaginalis (strain ATCC PRA-98 / G3) TaxID=412133 RepID=A2DS51_TRIV3|nr:glycine-rich protein family [Trichomonas vaginalis G3]EAY16821.1 loricrin, putative [Trichomonas vaginalis G3]KAI5490768.1 glycine-rich protein family [Trichomonas vaginalis G3]|eukprot:XP_001329044.1 loricrin [Trichomonas vaginalis G3]
MKEYKILLNKPSIHYSIVLPPGLFKFELYGASGGSYTDEVSSYHYESGACMPDNFVKLFNGNTKCLESSNYGGAGGYVSGIVHIRHPTKIYATIGGSGKYSNNTKCTTVEDCYSAENLVPGGYGGGGSSGGYTFGSSSGGGQTSVQFLENTLYHRVIVSGAGGGTDDYRGDDARGGSGGNLVAQGWWNESVYIGQYAANSSFGFTFGTGEAAQPYVSKNPKGIQISAAGGDKCGGGGGWFGGFASNEINSGCGGGSSWVLTQDAYIPQGLIKSHDEFYDLIDQQKYQFDLNSEYLFSEVQHVPGIWQGNGRLIITLIRSCVVNSCAAKSNFKYYLFGFFILS